MSIQSPTPNLEYQGVSLCLEPHSSPVQPGRPCQQLHYHWHISWEHWLAQAPPPWQGRDTIRGIWISQLLSFAVFASLAQHKSSSCHIIVECVTTSQTLIFLWSAHLLVQWCAMFSLGPRTSDLEYEITDLRGVNLFAHLPLSVSVLPGTWNCSPRFTLVWSSEQFTWAKITSRLGGEIRFRRILRWTQKDPCWLRVCVELRFG